MHIGIHGNCFPETGEIHKVLFNFFIHDASSDKTAHAIGVGVNCGSGFSEMNIKKQLPGIGGNVQIYFYNNRIMDVLDFN